MKTQTNTLNDSLIETRKSVNAAEKQANASMSQANTSQISARAAQASSNIAQQTFALIQRPAMGVVGVELRPVEGGVVVVVGWQNDGNLPARAATVRTSSGIGAAGTAERCAELWIKTPPSGSIFSRATISIHARFLSLTHPAISDESMKPVKEGKTWLYVYSRIEYGSDGRTQPYFTEYYARYRAGEFDICDRHNDAK